MKKKYRMMTILLLAALMVPAGSLYAQSGTDPDRARYEIERTDEVLANATEIVRDTRSQKARTSLEYAMKLQERAKSSASIAHNSMAIQLTGQARKEAWHAINLARTAARMEERTRRLSEHTTEKLIHLRARLAETGLRDERTLRLMMESQAMLEKARMNYRELRGELALKLAENSFRLANQAEERFRQSLGRMEMCQRRLTLLERLSERAHANVGESAGEKERMQLERADEHLARARNAMSAGRYEVCRMNIESAERMLRNLTRTTSRVRAGDPEAAIEEARRLQHRAEEMVGAPGEAPEQALRLLEQARRMLDRAEDELAGGNGDEALRLTTEARRMLRRAVELSRGETGPGEAAAEVERAAQLGELVRAILEDCETEGAGDLMNRAEEHLRKARADLDGGRHERAVSEARIARNLYNRVREICAR